MKHLVERNICSDCTHYPHCELIRDLIRSANYLESSVKKYKSFEHVSVQMDCKEKTTVEKASIDSHENPTL